MKHRWIAAWAVQIAESLAAGLLAALAQGLSPALGGIALWGLAPLAGLLTACRAVRRGLNNYAAWLAPPACLWGAFLIVWHYSPPAGAGLLTAFVALVGAAAGEVLIHQRHNSRNRRHTRS